MLGAGLPTPHLRRPIDLTKPGDLRSAVSARSGDLRTSTSQIHLVEIDLLSGGQHTTAVPLRRLRAKAGPFDYHVCIHRFDNMEDYFVYPIRLQDRLPEIAIPLLPGDGDVAIDLQEVFQRSYDAGPYRRRIRYSQTETLPPLDADARQWAAQPLL